MDKDRVKMPWGKHRDEFIDEIPSSYLRYAAENWDEKTTLQKKIVAECDREWNWREANNRHIDE